MRYAMAHCRPGLEKKKEVHSGLETSSTPSNQGGHSRRGAPAPAPRPNMHRRLLKVRLLLLLFVESPPEGRPANPGSSKTSGAAPARASALAAAGGAPRPAARRPPFSGGTLARPIASAALPGRCPQARRNAPPQDTPTSPTRAGRTRALPRAPARTRGAAPTHPQHGRPGNSRPEGPPWAVLPSNHPS
ncbi:MAG: hypothetical protein J3K34DRAFT_137577 [Monoraphidium minutum]|nr:MAG: hypothetical protein J3K34DRAFT_137577 [Monoraphidium minutum]